MADTLYVSKPTQTATDALLAYGLALFLERMFPWLQEQGGEILLQDKGPYYVIRLPVSIEDVHISQISATTLLAPLITESQTAKRGDLTGFDYSGQWEISRVYNQQLQELPPSQRHPDAIRIWNRQEKIYPPHPLFNHYRYIHDLMAINTFNEVVIRWSTLSQQHQQMHVHFLFDLFATPFHDLEQTVTSNEGIVTWRRMAKQEGISGSPEVTALQLVNPSQGKGSNSPKANRMHETQMKQFWLQELLKYLGYLYATRPYQVRDKTEDLKFYVLQPAQITLRALHAMMNEIYELCWSTTPIKLDIILVLFCASLIVNEHNEFINLRDENQPPRTRLQGLKVTTYKNMGKAYQVMNMGLLGLPPWIQTIETSSAADQISAFIQRQMRLIRALREEHDEERTLLKHYRDFISANDLRAFSHFASAYGPLLVRSKSSDPNRAIFPLQNGDLELIYGSHDAAIHRSVSLL